MDRILSEGMTGQDVRALQDVLNFHIRRGEPLEVDGIFGPKTRSRVLEFQKVNGLKVDGLVGPKTNGELFEATVLRLPLVFMPRSQPDPPESERSRTPRFKPFEPKFFPVPWLGPPFVPLVPFVCSRSFSLSPNKYVCLPELTDPADALGLKITVPTRKDPADPYVKSREATIEFIDELPADSKFRAWLISKVPDAVTHPSPPSSGFGWGVLPLFPPLGPTGLRVQGNAQFTVRLTDGGNRLPNLVFGAWGDVKFFLNFNGKYGQSAFAVQAEGQMFLGVKGVF